MKAQAVFLFAFCTLLVVGSQAATVYSNLSGSTPVSGEIVGQDPPSTYEIADAFVPAQSYQLTLGIAFVRRETGAAPLIANLWSDANGTPGMILTTTSVAAANVSTSQSNVTFTFPTGVNLVANTRYWFSLTSSANSQYEWVSNQAATYPEDYRINGGAWNGPDSPMSTFEIDGQAVPEPPSSALVAAVLAAGWLWHHSARRRPRSRA